MAAITGCQESIRYCGGLDLLVSFLHQKPCLLSSTAERSACERVQQKAAIALMRLCQDTRLTYSVIRQKGSACELCLLVHNCQFLERDKGRQQVKILDRL